MDECVVQTFLRIRRDHRADEVTQRFRTFFHCGQFFISAARSEPEVRPVQRGKRSLYMPDHVRGTNPCGGQGRGGQRFRKIMLRLPQMLLRACEGICIRRRFQLFPYRFPERVQPFTVGFIRTPDNFGIHEFGNLRIIVLYAFFKVLPCGTVDIMSHAEVILNKSRRKLKSGIVIDQNQQIQIGFFMNIAGHERTVNPDHRQRSGTDPFGFRNHRINNSVIPFFKSALIKIIFHRLKRFLEGVRGNLFP